MTELLTPARHEAESLLASPAHFRGRAVCEDALPPAFLLERGISAEDGGWRMPRLFVDVGADRIVGSGAFKSEPRERRIEIGYGVSPACRGCGFATEGVRLLVQQAFSSGEVDEVFAETSLSNPASQMVLQKAGFAAVGSRESDEGPMIRWVLRRGD